MKTPGISTRFGVGIYIPRWEQSASSDQVAALSPTNAITDERSVLAAAKGLERRHNPDERRKDQRRQHRDRSLFDTRGKQERRIFNRRSSDHLPPQPDSEQPSPANGIDVLA